MGLGDDSIARLAALAAGQVGASARRRGGAVEGKAKPAARGWARWLGEPRAAVLIVLFLVVGIGGGRKLLQGWRGRKAVVRLAEPDVSIEDIEAAILKVARASRGSATSTYSLRACSSWTAAVTSSQ